MADRTKGMCPGIGVGQTNTREHGLSVVFTRHVHQPGEPLGDELEAGALRIGAGLPEARYRCHHQVWLEQAEIAIAEALACEYAGAEILDNHIYVGNQLPHDGLALGGVDVEGNALLPPVLLDVGTDPPVDPRPVGPVGPPQGGCSILSTSAPSSTSIRVHAGPAR